MLVGLERISMMVMQFDFEVKFAEWCKSLTFSVMASSYEDAIDQIQEALKSIGAENVRRDTHVFEKPVLLRARRGE